MDDVTRRRIKTLDRSEALSAARSSAQGGKVGKRASKSAKVDALMQRKRTCGYLIELVFDGDVAAFGFVEIRQPRRKSPQEKAPPNASNALKEELIQMKCKILTFLMLIFLSLPLFAAGEWGSYLDTGKFAWNTLERRRHCDETCKR